MKSYYYLFISMFGLASQTLAHVGEQVYEIHQLPSNAIIDLHDGSLADWYRFLPEPTLTEADFITVPFIGEGAPIGGADLRVNIFLAWSASPGRLYAAFERFDDRYINTYDGETSPIWHHDSIEFNVDGDHSGGVYSTLDTQGFCDAPVADYIAIEAWECIVELFESSRQAQSYHIIAQAPADVPLLELYVEKELGLSRSLPLPYTKRWAQTAAYANVGGFVEEGPSHRSVVEFMITPFDTLDIRGPAFSQESMLALGAIIGLQIALPDFDVQPYEYHAFSSFEGQAALWRNADSFIDVELVGPPDVPSSVNADSWGRIKGIFKK